MKKWKVRFCQRIDGVANRGECIVVARMVRDALAEFDRKGFVNASVIAVWQMVEGEWHGDCREIYSSSVVNGLYRAAEQASR